VVLGFIIIIEWIAAYMANKYNYNGLVYNILDFIWYPGYMLIFYGLIDSEKKKKWIIFLLILFYGYAIFNFATAENHVWLAHKTIIAGALCLIFCSVLALWQITNHPHHVALRTNPLFWISVSMLCYFFPSAILVGGFEYFKMQEIPVSNAYGNAFVNSQKILNIIHYSILIYAFLIPNVEKKRSIKS
jgi:hypothetical protein